MRSLSRPNVGEWTAWLLRGQEEHSGVQLSANRGLEHKGRADRDKRTSVCSIIQEADMPVFVDGFDMGIKENGGIKNGS